MAAKAYRSWNPKQSYLLPPSPTEWLPEGHLCYFLLDVVETLDISAIERAIHSKDPRGERPYAPKMMVALLLYGYCVGVFSSRKIARATYDDVAFRVMAAESHPHFTRINRFRLDHLEALAGLFVEVLTLCRKAGLVKLGHISIDGTKVQANASKHKAMSYERMQKEEARLRAEIDALLTRADTVDREEDARYGKGQDVCDLPAELSRREGRLAKIRAAKTALEQEAAQARAEALREQADAQRKKAGDPTVEATGRRRAKARAERSEGKARELDREARREDADDDDDGDAPRHGSGGNADDLPRHRMPTTPEGAPAPKAQRNFTDPQSRIMKNNRGFLQGYNAQIAVDAEAQVIVAQAVTNQPPDAEHLIPVLDRVAGNCGREPAVVSADSGYFSRDNVAACEQRGIDPHIAVGRQKHGQPDKSAEIETPRPQTPAEQAKERMREKLASEPAKAIYARRKVIVEPPFGQIKEARRFRRFSLRGLKKVRCEWALVALTHNLLKLYRALRSANSGGCAPTALTPA